MRIHGDGQTSLMPRDNECVERKKKSLDDKQSPNTSNATKTHKPVGRRNKIWWLSIYKDTIRKRNRLDYFLKNLHDRLLWAGRRILLDGRHLLVFGIWLVEIAVKTVELLQDLQVLL